MVKRKVAPMATQQITSTLKEKIPSYVAVYNRLYSEIVKGELADGLILPSEADMAKTYGVSRNTLRQALTVLNEDGLISKQQGKGSVVTYKPNQRPMNLNGFVNPLIHFSKEPIDAIDISFNFNAPTEVAQQKLGIQANEILMASNAIYYSNGKAIARAFIQIPAKHIEQIQLDLNEEAEVSKLVNETIFEIADFTQMTIKAVLGEGELLDFLPDCAGQPLQYVEEILINKAGDHFARCKLYFMPEWYEFTLRC